MDVRTKTLTRRLNGLINTPVKLYANPGAESALLTLCCQEEHARTAYTAALRAGVELDDFSHTFVVHRLVWLALSELHHRNRPVTRATLSSAIKRQVGATPPDLDTDLALGALIDQPCSIDSLDVYVNEVREAGIKRMAQLEGLEIAHSVGVMDPAAIATRMNAIGERALLDSDQGTSHAAMFDVMKGHLVSQYGKAVVGKTGGLDTPLRGLNFVLNGGFKPGCIHYWGGTPGAGKTRLLTYLMADQILRHRAIVDWYSVETVNTKTMALFIAAAESLRATDRRRNTLTVDQIHELNPSADDVRACGGDRALAVTQVTQRVNDALRRARDWPGELAHQMVGPEFTAQHIYAQVRSRVLMREAERDTRPYVVVVDYVQGVRSGERGLSGQEEIQRTCERLRYLCKNLNVYVHVIYHTNRANALQAHGSSQVEKDADFAAVVVRDPDHPDSVTLTPTKTRDAACVASKLTADFARVNYGDSDE